MNPDILFIGIKDVLMNEPYQGWAGKNWFYPAYHNQTGEIIGT